MESMSIYKGCRCSLCSKPLRNAKNLVCSNCLSRKNYFNKGFSLFVYNESNIKKVIEYIKFYHKPHLVKFLMHYSNFIKELDIFEDCDYLIPIPMHRDDIEERGYNQSAYIAKIISKITGIPVGFDILIKTKKTKKQVGLKQKERLKNLSRAFDVLKIPNNIRKITLIDDVFTTGSTINECAKILKRHNIKSNFFTIATTSDINE